ncbi:MAG: VTT domain-containing protein [Alphaproteobacteria bacterium]|nr:VTT domain-containing protein [Alphaproteobacteria bacterium]
MEDVVRLIEQFGLLAVFFTVLLDEGGLPIPASPLLAVAGALTARGELNLTALIAAAVAGSVIADNGWYGLGRTRGRRVVGFLCKLSLSPDSCVRDTETLFVRVGPSALLFAKFIPALGNVTIALAGITRVPFAIFLPLEVAGATLYLATPILLGRIFHNAVSELLNTLERLGVIGVGLLAAALLLYLFIRWWQRMLFIRQLRMDRITVEELAALLDNERKPLVLDVRSRAARAEGVIPGAIPAHPTDMHPVLAHHDRDAEIVVYCACPNEATAAVAAKHLKAAGFKRIRPLLGGVEAWALAGHQLVIVEDGQIGAAA